MNLGRQAWQSSAAGKSVDQEILMTTLTPHFRVIMLVLLLGAATSALAQGTRSDYERADKLRDLARKRVFKTRVRPHWLADNSRFWYRNDLPGKARAFVLVDALQGKRQPAFDHAKLAQ